VGFLTKKTRNSSGDEIANVNFLYDDIVHVLQNTIDCCCCSSSNAYRTLQHHYEFMGHNFVLGLRTLNQSISQSLF